MASCVRNIRTKNYQNLIIRFQVTVENVGMLFWDTVYLKNAMDTADASNATFIILRSGVLIGLCVACIVLD